MENIDKYTFLLYCLKKQKDMNNTILFNPAGNFSMKMSTTNTGTFLQKPFMAGMNALLQPTSKLKQPRDKHSSLKRNPSNSWRF